MSKSFGHLSFGFHMPLGFGIWIFAKVVLEDMAIHYKIPLSRFLKELTPKFIQQIPIPYYASQTTAIARVEK